IHSFALRHPPPPCSTLFPYTTLFRSLSYIELLRTGIPSGCANFTGNLLCCVQLDIGKNDVRALLCKETCDLLSNARSGSRYEGRSEEHTSELQSRFDLVCRLLLEKKK